MFNIVFLYFFKVIYYPLKHVALANTKYLNQKSFTHVQGRKKRGNVCQPDNSRHRSHFTEAYMMLRVYTKITSPHLIRNQSYFTADMYLLSNVRSQRPPWLF